MSELTIKKVFAKMGKNNDIVKQLRLKNLATLPQYLITDLLQF